jgi:hypothetical protein
MEGQGAHGAGRYPPVAGQPGPEDSVIPSLGMWVPLPLPYWRRFVGLVAARSGKPGVAESRSCGAPRLTVARRKSPSQPYAFQKRTSSSGFIFGVRQLTVSGIELWRRQKSKKKKKKKKKRKIKRKKKNSWQCPDSHDEAGLHSPRLAPLPPDRSTRRSHQAEGAPSLTCTPGRTAYRPGSETLGEQGARLLL